MTEKERGQEEMSKKTDDLQRAFEDGWEISEDDFEETQDLAETAAQLSDLKDSFEDDEEPDDYEEEAAEELWEEGTPRKESAVRREKRDSDRRDAGGHDTSHQNDVARRNGTVRLSLIHI